ncbi:hypothetical protein AB1Y20_010292 [Prymnesium parvum]|uniref:Transcription initiation factor TFIID subunit 2 n=1 Tax=Prymnesium parvum TaxID=97485 RepID=A0AB34K7J0_PRYPA
MAPSAAQWEVLHQTTSLHLDVRQQALRGRTELRLRLSPRTPRLSLHCASQCVVDRCSLTFDGSGASHRLFPHRPCAALLDVPVPRRYQTTRDLPSFLSALGGTLDAADKGELEVALPPHDEKQQATLAIEYRVDAIRGGVHFPRATRDAAPMVAHTAAEAGAVRFWMPCVDRVEVIRFHRRVPTPRPQHTPPRSAPALAERTATSTPRDASLHTLGFELDHPVMASQVGFVVGKLLLADHPALPAWTLALGSLSASPSQVKQLWQQLVDASRLLPDLRAFLSSQLLELPEAAGAPPQAARRRAAEPFSHHALVALQGAKELFSSFAGLVIIDAAQLHPQQAIEPARKLRLLLARAFGRAWLLSGVWLDDWIEAWLLMAMEGRLLHAYTQHAFGRNEATFRLHQERRALCDDSTCLPLVPSLEELERCGWRMHADQMADEHRMRKAAYVLSMVERMMLRVEHGASNFRQVLCSIAVYPPLRDVSGRIRSTDDFIERCRSKGVELDELKEHWIVGGRPCPTIEANFAYIKRKNLIELVVGAPSSKYAKLCDKLCVGWGELDASGAGIPKEKSIRLNEGLQLVQLDVDARRSRKRGRVESTEGEGGESVQESNVPLLWLRIDPELEYPLRVIWTGRRDEPNWTGQPEFMCREQLERTIDVVSQIEAAMALSTFRTHTAVDALHAALSKPTNYYRVRVAAAASLALLSRASALLDAKDKLIDYLVDEYFVDEHLAPNDFSDLSAYAVRKAVVEAIGNCRDDEGRAHPECILTLLSILDENDNSRNDFEDGYALGATIRSLAGAVCAGCEEYVDELMQNINRHLQLDELQPSHDCILTCCCLQALVELELTGLREPQLELYEYHEQHGETARLRLTAADCLLRLRLLQPAGREPSDGSDGAEKPSRCVLTLALQLADKRVHMPQEELLLWQVLLLLLRTHADAVARQKELLSDKGSSEAVAATQYLWHRMNVEAHGHMRLRLALVSVWSELFGDGTAACLPFQQPITYLDILPAYVPLKKSQADQREVEKAEAIKRQIERDKQKEIERQSAEKSRRQAREEREAAEKRKLEEQLRKEQENS